MQHIYIFFNLVVVYIIISTFLQYIKILRIYMFLAYIIPIIIILFYDFHHMFNLLIKLNNLKTGFSHVFFLNIYTSSLQVYYNNAHCFTTYTR